MYTKHSNYAFLCCLRTYLSPLFSSDEYNMDLLRLWRAPPLSEFSQTMGTEEKQVYSNSKTDVIHMNKHTVFGFIPSYLRDHTLWLLSLMSLRPIIQGL